MTAIVVSVITGLFAMATTFLTLRHQSEASKRSVSNQADHAEVLLALQGLDKRMDDHMAWHAHSYPDPPQQEVAI